MPATSVLIITEPQATSRMACPFHNEWLSCCAITAMPWRSHSCLKCVECSHQTCTTLHFDLMDYRTCKFIWQTNMQNMQNNMQCNKTVWQYVNMAIRKIHTYPFSVCNRCRILCWIGKIICKICKEICKPEKYKNFIGAWRCSSAKRRAAFTTSMSDSDPRPARPGPPWQESTTSCDNIMMSIWQHAKFTHNPFYMQ